MTSYRGWKIETNNLGLGMYECRAEKKNKYPIYMEVYAPNRISATNKIKTEIDMIEKQGG